MGIGICQTLLKLSISRTGLGELPMIFSDTELAHWPRLLFLVAVITMELTRDHRAARIELLWCQSVEITPW